MDWETFETQINQSEENSSFSAIRQSTRTAVYGAMSMGDIAENRYTYYNVFYPWEVMKGYPGVGDQITLFELRFDLKIGESNYVLFSDVPITDPAKMIKTIEKRYASLPKPMDYPKGLIQMIRS